MATLKNHPGYWLRDDAAAQLDLFEEQVAIITINSAGRTPEEQWELINRWDQGGYWNRPPFLYEPARPPEASNHVSNGGIAIDTPNIELMLSRGRPYGFIRPYDWDKPHFEFRPELVEIRPDHSKPANTTDKEQDMRLLRDNDRHSIFFNDEFGADHLMDYISPDIDPTEYLTAAQAAFPSTGVSARQWDIVNAIANRRWAVKRGEIVNETVARLAPLLNGNQNIALDPELVKSAIKEALSSVEVDATVDAATIDRIANTVLDKQHERLAQ